MRAYLAKHVLPSLQQNLEHIATSILLEKFFVCVTNVLCVYLYKNKCNNKHIYPTFCCSAFHTFCCSDTNTWFGIYAFIQARISGQRPACMQAARRRPNASCTLIVKLQPGHLQYYFFIYIFVYIYIYVYVCMYLFVYIFFFIYIYMFIAL